MRVLFRVDASRSIGFGHLYRCLALANALRENGETCVFVCQSLSGDGILQIENDGFSVVKLSSMLQSGHDDFVFLSQVDFDY